MKTKFFQIPVAALLLSALPLTAANVAFVSYHSADDTPTANAANAGFTNAPDVGYTRLLAAAGHNVTRYLTTATPDTALLNTFDLVILSRSVPSGHYQTEPSPTDWNGITAPMIVLNGYLTRGGTGGGSRLGLTTGETMVDVNSSQIRLRANAPAHPIFSGVSLDANNLMVNPYAQRVAHTNATTGVVTNQTGISVNTSAVVAGGSVLAVVGTTGDAALNGMIIGEFPSGLTTSRANLLGAKRLTFFTGSRESGITSEGSGIFDLLPDGAKLFTNAVNYMLSSKTAIPGVVVTPTLGTNLVAGDAWTFTANAWGADPVGFQWYHNNQELTGSTGPTLAFTGLTAADVGDYTVVVTNAFGSATSSVARLEFAVVTPPSITNSLIAYWPLDQVAGTKTPDMVSGYDMTLNKMGATNVVAGRWGNAFRFSNAGQTLLERLNNPGDALPIYQHANFSVSLWVFGGIQTDHRVFSEGSTTSGNPLFNLGTHNGGSDGTVDIYIRNDTGGTVGDHRHSVGAAFYGDGWHNIVYVQRDVGGGQMRAQLYVDGALDTVTITPVRPLTANTTSIGGIRRASPSAWFDGDIDEVAVWNRALSAAEVQILQGTSITNWPSRTQPLVINSFKADLPAVVNNGTTTLRWDVSKDASQVTIMPFGDVTAQTTVGIGSRAITNTQTTTYVLTILRGLESLSATTSVAVVDGVNPGWTVLDNFDTYSAGTLFAKPYWSDVTGNSASVVDVGGNPALRTANGVTYLNLRDLTLQERQATTLFFRLIPGASDAVGVTNIVGLTDKSQRGFGDNYQNIGPVVYPNPLTNDLAGITTNAWHLGARNGWFGNNTSAPIDYPAIAPVTPFEAGTVYNIWIDITNASWTTDFASDEFSVWVQKEGAAARTLVFSNYVSDRDPYYVDAVLGGMLPNLDKLVVMGNSGTVSATVDDFYLSTSGYNATVPRPYGFTGQVGPLPALQIGKVGNDVEIRWTTGTLQESTSATGGWADVQGAAPPSYRVTPGPGSKFYRARP